LKNREIDDIDIFVIDEKNMMVENVQIQIKCEVNSENTSAHVSWNLEVIYSLK
jgi:hypothetical protein